MAVHKWCKGKIKMLGPVSEHHIVIAKKNIFTKSSTFHKYSIFIRVSEAATLPSSVVFIKYEIG